MASKKHLRAGYARFELSAGEDSNLHSLLNSRIIPSLAHSRLFEPPALRLGPVVARGIFHSSALTSCLRPLCPQSWGHHTAALP